MLIPHKFFDGDVDVVLDLPIAMTGLEHPWTADAADFPWHHRPWNAAEPSENVGTEPMHLPYGDVDNSFGMGIVNHTNGLAEEADPRSGEALGNVPLAFSHMALVFSCAHLSAARRGPLPQGPRDCAELALDRLLRPGAA